MKLKKEPVGFSLKAVGIIIVITAIVTSLTTGIIIYNNNKVILGGANWKNDDALQEFLKIYNSLDQDYYEDINKTEMVDAAISAMVDYLGEEYSIYLNQNETDNLSDQLSGKFTGIGVSIGQNNTIVKVYSDTPASRAGIMAGDIIVKINNTTTDGKTTAEVANLIDKSKENTIVVTRNSEELEFRVVPESINEPLTTNTYNQNGKNIGYIYIGSFTSTVGEEFKKSINELENDNINSLIIDLRGNTGGYLKGATDIASMFLEKGKIIYSLESKDKTEAYYDETSEKRDLPVVILIDETTASASEVLAAALKDSYGASLVGTLSYGKGKVQQTNKLDDGSMVKYTIAKWLRPNGECIDELGIEPDYNVELEYNEDGSVIDTQLAKALELLSLN